MSFAIFAKDVASKALKNVADNMDNTRSKLRQFTGEIDKSAVAWRAGGLALEGFARGLSAGGAALKASAMAAGAAGTAVAMHSLVQSIGQAATALGLLLPGAVAVAAAAIASVKVGLSGFSEAIAAMSDPTAFAEALKGLAPAARETALALQKLRPAWDAVKRSVQQELFRSAAKDIKVLGDAYLPLLERHLGGVAAQFSDAGREATLFAKSAQTKADFSAIFTSSQVSVGKLIGAVQPLLQIFRDIAAVGSGFMPAMAQNFANAAARAAEFVHKARESGQLQQSIANGLAVLRQFGAVLGNIGAIVSSVFSAASQGSGGFLTTLVMITRRIREFVESAEGAGFLRTVFEGLGQIIGAIGPLISEVGAVLASTLGPAIAQLAPMIAQAFTTLLPAIAPLGQIFAALAPVIGVLAQAFAQIAGIVAAALAPAIGAIAPVLPQLVDAFVQLVQAAAPLLPMLGQLIAEILPPFAKMLVDIGVPMIELAVKIAQFLAPALRDLAGLVIATVYVVATAFQSMWDLVSGIFNGFVDGVKFLVNGVTMWFNSLVSKLAGLAGSLAGAARSMFGGFLDAIWGVLGGIGQGALNLGKILVNSVVGVINKIIGGINNLLNFGFDVLGVRVQVNLGKIPTIPKLAAGGYVTGPGTSTSDSVPALLSHGEYVMNAAAVRRLGVAQLQALNAGAAPAGGGWSRGELADEILTALDRAKFQIGADGLARIVRLNNMATARR